MTSIQILGVKDYQKTVELRENAEEALKSLKLDLPIKEVNDVEHFLNLKVSGIPALVVDGKVAFQKGIPSVEDLIAYFNAVDVAEDPKLKIKRILLPTDFSTASKNSLYYAVELARQLQAEIKVVNCYAPAFDPNQLLPAEPIKEVVTEKLKKFVHLYPDQSASEMQPAVPIHFEGCMGFPVEEIIRLTGEASTDLVVMSTTGQHGFLEKVFGSVSAAVSRQAHCPVLLIPDGITYRPYRNILYATNEESVEDTMLQKITQFAKIFAATIHFVHVEEDASDKKTFEGKLFEEIFQEKAPEYAFQVSSIKANKVLEGIDGYARKNKCDLVVFITKHRSFWSNLVHKSLTRKMALNTRMPMLVMHLNEKV